MTSKENKIDADYHLVHNQSAGQDSPTANNSLTQQEISLMAPLPEKDSKKRGLQHERVTDTVRMTLDVELEEETPKERALNRVIRWVGDTGSYQQNMLFIATMTLFVGGFFIFLIPYTSPDPVASCKDSASGEMVECSEEKACKMMKDGQEAKVYFKTECWTKNYGLICDKADLRDQGRMILMFVNTIFLAIGLYLCDVVGRRIGFILATIMAYLGIFLCLFYDAYFIKMVGLGFANATLSIYCSLFTMVMNETTTAAAKIRSRITIVSFLGSAAGCIFFNIFAFISTEPNFLLYITLGFMVISNLPGCFYILDSPGHLTDLMKFEKVKTVAKTIRSRNKYKKNPTPQDIVKLEKCLRQLEEATLEEKRLKKEASGKTCPPFIEIFRTCRNAFQVLALSMIGGFIYSQYFGISIKINDLGLEDIKINGIIFGCTQLVGYILVLPYSEKMHRRKWHIIFQLIMIGGAAGLLGLSLSGTSPKIKLAQTLVSTVICGTTTSALFPLFFLYVSELFSPELRGTANSIVLLISNLIATVTPYLATASEKYHIHFLFGCSITALLSFPLTFCLRESLKKSEETEENPTK